MKVQGWDLALNHSAFVEYDQKTAKFDHFFITDKRRLVTDKGVLWDRKQYPDDKYRLYRLQFLAQNIMLHVETTKPSMVYIENYAMGKKHNAYHIGELGGIARSCLMERDIPYRLISPLTLKMWATGSRRAEKSDMIRAFHKEYGIDFLPMDQGLKTSDLAGDLADAGHLAMMANEKERQNDWP